LVNLRLHSVADALRQAVTEHGVEHLDILESIEGAALEYHHFTLQILMEPGKDGCRLPEGQGHLRLGCRGGYRLSIGVTLRALSTRALLLGLDS